LLFAAQVCMAEAPASKAHASRKSAIQLLRKEGILTGETRVLDATWNGKFWLVSLRHPGGKVTNWTIDADATDYRYICPH
jgi:hypothetical protein